MCYRNLVVIFLLFGLYIRGQEAGLPYYIATAKTHSPLLKDNQNLQKIITIQDQLILAQNRAFQVDLTAELQIAPYFDNNGRFIDITTTPSPTAYGYDVGITNGGLYSTQLNISKNLFNQAITDNLLLQNKVINNTVVLSSEAIAHNLIKNVVDSYIIAYQLQLQQDFNNEILKDLENRLQVVELLVQRGILSEGDYLLLQVDIEGKKLELQQIKGNYRTAINQLYTMCGIPAQDIEELAVPVLPETLSNTHYFFEKKFENDSLQLLADQEVFENQFKPQLTAYGNTGFNAVELTNFERRIGLSAGLRLTVPIYDGKQRKYNAQQNELKKESLGFYKEDAKIQLDNNLNNIRQQQFTLEKNMKSMEGQLEKQRNVLDIYKGKLVQGQVSIVDYINVVQNYKLNVYTKLQMQTNRWLIQNQYNFLNW